MRATLTTPKGKAFRSDATLYDCGRHGKLTARQIARRAGITVQAVKMRYQRGDRGVALLRTDARSEGASTAPARATLRNAVRLVRAFPDKVPTTAEIRRVVPLSDAQASRYRAALRETLDPSPPSWGP